VFLVLRSVPTDLASVHALVGDEGLGVVLESVRLQSVSYADAGRLAGFVRCGK
jgi:hypothetical protein